MIEVKGVFGRWYGGSGYAESHAAEAVESFGTAAGAREALLERAAGGTMVRRFEYVLRMGQAVSTPGVDERSRIELCRVYIDAGRIVIGAPYATLRIGVRGGVRRSTP